MLIMAGNLKLPLILTAGLTSVIFLANAPKVVNTGRLK